MLEPTRPRGTVGVLWGTVRVMCVCGVLYRTQPKQEPRLKKRMRARLPRSNEIRFGADGSFHGQCAERLRARLFAYFRISGHRGVKCKEKGQAGL